MKPIAVQAGENAPDVDDLMEKAKNMDDLLEKNERLMDNSQMKNITGVEEAPMTHYWTNQNQPSEGIESVTKRGASTESVTFIDANPHQTGSALAAHENSAGGDTFSAESSERYGAGSSGVKKAKPNALAAMLAGGGGPPGGGPPGGGPPGMGDGGPPLDDMGDGGPPGMGDEEDMPDDASGLSMKIHDMVDKLSEMAGGGEDPGMDEMGGGPPGLDAGPPMGGGGGPPGM